MKKGSVKKLKVNWFLIIALVLAISISSCYADAKIKKDKKTELEKRIEEFMNQNPLKLNSLSPTGTIVDYENNLSGSNHK